MATIDTLIKEIYFEKQEEGSMLCAQHALNSLLQDEYFTAPDLAAIAKELDQLEEGYDDANFGESSTNMDDTGFFSIQVIEEALKSWSLSLRRWRSEAMRPYQDRPHCQLAFILNSRQHWYTLRRFGEASPDFTRDSGIGHWFDLNSFNANPMWIGKTFLGMTLQQAETEGYSVFAVVQDDPAKPLALPRSEADYIAAFVTEDSRPSAAYRSGATRAVQSSKLGVEELDDEDAELQAALQASILGGTFSIPPSFDHPTGQSSTASGSSGPTPAAILPRAPFRSIHDGSNLPPPTHIADEDFDMLEEDPDYPPVIPPQPTISDDLDPLAASRARNQAYMQQVMREQEEALRESRQAEMAAVQAGYRTRRPNPRQQEEDDELQRAIEASRVLHEAQGSSAVHRADDVLDIDDEDVNVPRQEYSRQPLSAVHGNDRVYDDDDEELQAALRASLADVPSGFTVPATPPRSAPPLPTDPVTPVTPALPQSTGATPDDERDIETETESEADTAVDEEERRQVTMEEMRRKRLERFGG
ncbi:Josephin-domain-containing protein [Trametopsis cervina]|nr:Josephin-domain-containing protein [Trametopsis cervina]